MAVNGYQHYKEQTVNTMTAGEMLNLLYDELLKRLTRSELALENKDYELFEQSIQRSMDIVTYLKDTLNFQYEISNELKRLYDFFLYELVRIKAGRNSAVISEIRPLIMDLRDSFREAQRIGG
ncbi:flagellar export chaperone FliS [Clostridium boliviensis]|uniref:Flagellar export chaperone FliS n=1 Tax=Clostridium boliviensis TaxID=318465 RepID=A0ABU4GMC8_9CLOT|nr:flagellar export chaperone FliS [Clostridium boliviensis]MDW2798118.1 flagellar export chaperone FliS [Clostridium boliviensis]